MGRKLEIEWQESAEELKRRYKQERDAQRRTRLLALWHLREGESLTSVAKMVGVVYRVAHRWVAWYQAGGLEAVLRRVTGHQAQGVPPYLNALQQKALAARVELGDFKTVWEVKAWVEARWGVVYTYKGMYSVLKRHDVKLKGPRPQSEKANVEQQEPWKKGA